MSFSETVETVGRTIEGVGVAVTVVGLAVALAVYARRVLAPGDDSVDAYTTARRDVGRSVLLGLEVLVAGDIIRTVAVDPSFTSVGVLAVIVLVRTFLSLTIELEISGRWPWQQRGGDPAGEHG